MARSFSHFLLAAAAAAVVGGSISAQTPLQEAVKLLRLNKTEEGMAKLKEIVAADPSNEQALELYRSVSQDEWFMLMTMKGEPQQIAQMLLDRARVDMKTRSRDEAAIAALVETATAKDSDYGARARAVNTLIKEHGEFSVPALLVKLGNPDDEDAQIHAQIALQKLGSAAVMPLLQALKSTNLHLVRNIAAALSAIDDERAMAYLAQLANDDRIPVREIATRYTAKKGIKGADAKQLMLKQALDYLKGNVPPGAFSEVVWTFQDEKLVPNDVNAMLFACELAKSVAADAVRIAPADKDARSMLAQANLAQANLIETSIQKGDEAMKALEPVAGELRIAALATGLDSLRGALESGLRENLAPVAVGAIGALEIAESRESLAQSPLLTALDSSDKRVRYAAANAAVKISGGVDVPQNERVVAVLGDAVTEQALRSVQVIAPESTTKGVVETVGKPGNGPNRMVVEASHGAIDGIRSMLLNPNVDVLVINEVLPDRLPEDVIGNVTKDPRHAGIKILVITRDEEAAKARFGDSVGFIKGPLSGELLVTEVNKALEGMPSPEGARAEGFAVDASAALADLAANSKGSITPVLSNIAAQLNRTDSVSVPAAKALGQGGGAAELSPLVVALGGSGSVELKKAAAEAIGNICARLGNCPDDAANALIGALDANQDAGLRTVVGAALSKVTLQPAKHAEVMQKLNRIATGTPAATEG